MEVVETAREAVAAAVQPLLARAGFAQAAATGEVPVAPQFLRAEAVAQAREGLRVEHLPRSHVIAITFATEDPVEAAQTANALAEGYVAQQRVEKVGKTQRARLQLMERAQVLQEELRQAELQVREYRERTGLASGLQGVELSQQQLVDLTTELMAARGDRAALEARLTQIESLRGLPNATDRLSEALGSPLVNRLREDRLDLLREYAQLAREFGERHPRIIELRSQQTGIEERIIIELENALSNLRNDVASARAREAAMQAVIDEAKGESAVTDLATVELEQLMRQAEAARNIYEAFLMRASEIAEQETLVEADARVLQSAITPLYPSSPRTLLFTVAGLMVSLAFGSVMVFVREQTDRRLRNADQIQTAMQLTTLGLVPRHRGFGGTSWSEEDIAENTQSAFAESVRGICAQLRLSHGPWEAGEAPEHASFSGQRSSGGRVLLVASALPNEGKSTLAIALAMIGAPQFGRTLLIDGDLRRPAIADRLHLDPSGQRARRKNKLSLEGVVRHAGVDVLINLSEGNNPAATLAGSDMRTFLNAARRHYDWIVVDAPPVLGLPDTQILSQHADAVLLVGRWGQSRITSTRAAAKRLRQAKAPNVAAVITDVDMRKHAGYYYEDEAQYYKSYKGYYHD